MQLTSINNATIPKIHACSFPLSDCCRCQLCMFHEHANELTKICDRGERPRQSYVDIMILRSVHLDSCSVSPPAALSISQRFMQESSLRLLVVVVSCVCCTNTPTNKHKLKISMYQQTTPRRIPTPPHPWWTSLISLHTESTCRPTEIHGLWSIRRPPRPKSSKTTFSTTWLRCRICCTAQSQDPSSSRFPAPWNWSQPSWCIPKQSSYEVRYTTAAWILRISVRVRVRVRVRVKLLYTYSGMQTKLIKRALVINVAQILHSYYRCVYCYNSISTIRPPIPPPIHPHVSI